APSRSGFLAPRRFAEPPLPGRAPRTAASPTALRTDSANPGTRLAAATPTASATITREARPIMASSSLPPYQPMARDLAWWHGIVFRERAQVSQCWLSDRDHGACSTLHNQERSIAGRP